MPIYVFQCEPCGVRFEKLYKSVSKADNAAKCPECGKPCRKLPTAANHSFKHGAGQTRGPLPPNTGTSDDWNYDKVIGRDAAEKWGEIDKRNAAKDRVIRHEREAGRDVSREQLVPTPERKGDYRVITEPERKHANAGRKLAKEGRKHLPKNEPLPSGE